MKTAIRVLVFAGMLVATFANAQSSVGRTGNFGEPVPFPIPPQMLQVGSFGQPVPFPIPPTQISQVAPQGEPVPFPIPPASGERV